MKWTGKTFQRLTLIMVSAAITLLAVEGTLSLFTNRSLKPQTPFEDRLRAAEDALQQRLAELLKKQEQQKAEQARKNRLDALRAAAAAQSAQIESPVAEAPVGMLDGKGNEAGVSAIAFVQEYIRQQWNLSQYQVSGNPEAEAVLLYSATGKLLHYRFVKKSGNNIFDESLTRAINKSKQLNQPLPKQMEFQVVFNLKEMLDRP